MTHTLPSLFGHFPISGFSEMPVDSLAYIGDAVIALRYKLYILKDGRIKTNTLNNASKKYLTAHAHSFFIDRLNEKNFFDETEKAIFKRGYNSKGAKKRGNNEEYRKSTGFEAVIGYLYLSDNYKRLEEIFEVIETCTYMGEM
ncbi:MAG TPA: ribonuclease III domain-containing protein [Petrotogaceae bacterium]|jgi:ribonuclease-3 family protein|nr:ribonuclease III domain-containing protein [Petrotogaceae bacterium]